MNYECAQPISLADAEKFRNIVNYLLLKRGPLSSNIPEAGAFIKTRADLDAPDIEFMFAPVFYMAHGFDNPAGHGFAIGIVLEHPESHGQISLRSNDPTAAPAIQPNYLSRESDLTVILAGLKLARQIAQANALAPYRGQELWPAPEADSDEEMTAFIRRTLESCYHPVGTCKMCNDRMAVVDPQLRAHGVEGLRVADASVFPTHITGHPNAPIIMMAEKAAAMITEPENTRMKAIPSATPIHGLLTFNSLQPPGGPLRDFSWSVLRRFDQAPFVPRRKFCSRRPGTRRKLWRCGCRN